MSVYLLLLHLAGAVTLLLWAVRMVRTGVERSQEPALKRLLRESKGGRLRAAAIGAGVAVVLQSSTAVAILAAGFAGTGLITLATGLALMLGADFGSSIVVQILSVDLGWLMPVLLIAGGALFFKGTSRDLKQIGRVLIGIALILLALQMIGEATAPLRGAAFLPQVISYLRGDFLTAFLIGALFTWLGAFERCFDPSGHHVCSSGPRAPRTWRVADAGCQPRWRPDRGRTDSPGFRRGATHRLGQSCFPRSRCGRGAIGVSFAAAIDDVAR